MKLPQFISDVSKFTKGIFRKGPADSTEKEITGALEALRCSGHVPF